MSNFYKSALFDEEAFMERAAAKVAYFGKEKNNQNEEEEFISIERLKQVIKKLEPAFLKLLSYDLKN